MYLLYFDHFLPHHLSYPPHCVCPSSPQFIFMSLVCLELDPLCDRKHLILVLLCLAYFP
jgi:hypothetical protein